MFGVEKEANCLASIKNMICDPDFLTFIRGYVLLAANPLQEIKHTRRIDAVSKDGMLCDRKKLDELDEFSRAQGSASHNWAKLLWGFARSSVNADM